jgi:GH18 family chitinase
MISTNHLLFLTTFTPIFSFVHGLPLDSQFVAQAGPRRDSTETFTLNADTLEAGLVLSSENLLSAPSPAVVATSVQELAESVAPLVMAYYPDWAASEFPPESIDFTRFDWIDFAFALPDDNCGLTWDDPQEAPSLLTRLVNAAHAHGKKVKLSVGGWTGSR